MKESCGAHQNFQTVNTVRVCAPLQMRVQRMMERLNTDDEGFVTNEIKMSEEAHAAITRRHFGISWQHSDQYDLVLNTERISIEECADEILALAKDPQFQETAQSKQMLANLALEAHVRAALRADPRTTKMQISISADQGTVTIAGIVDRGSEPVDASEVAAAVPGVKNIKNQLNVVATSRVKLDG